MGQTTSIVIPLGKGSAWGNNELKYCLRAVEKYLSEYGEVFIIGELPKWIQNVIHIPFTEINDPKIKERNIFTKILCACDDERITDDFLFFNDDHILLSDFDASIFPNFKKEDLMFYAKRNVENEQYCRTLLNTIMYLSQKNKLGIENFDCHCPIIYNKNKFKELQEVDWEIENGYAIKSLYANINKIEGVYIEDVKCGSMGQSKDWLQGRLLGKKLFSLTHYVNDDMRKLLQELFPDPSKYEA